MEVTVYPFAAMVEAVPHGLDAHLLLLVAHRDVITSAAPELASEQGCVQDSEQEQEEEDDQLQVHDWRQRFE